jgi:hypothetical protein
MKLLHKQNHSCTTKIGKHPNLLLVSLSCFALASQVTASDFKPQTIGTRVSCSASSLKNEFISTEIFTEWSLGSYQSKPRGWYCERNLELSLGVVTFEQQGPFEAMFGPVVRLGHDKSPLYFDLGSSPTILSRHAYRKRDLGAHLQFTSHVGAGIKLHPRFQIEYRYAHMSNGGFANPNPGINFHTVGVRFTF